MMVMKTSSCTRTTIEEEEEVVDLVVVADTSSVLPSSLLFVVVVVVVVVVAVVLIFLCLYIPQQSRTGARGGLWRQGGDFQCGCLSHRTTSTPLRAPLRLRYAQHTASSPQYIYRCSRQRRSRFPSSVDCWNMENAHLPWIYSSSLRSSGSENGVADWPRLNNPSFRSYRK